MRSVIGADTTKDKEKQRSGPFVSSTFCVTNTLPGYLIIEMGN